MCLATATALTLAGCTGVSDNGPTVTHTVQPDATTPDSGAASGDSSATASTTARPAESPAPTAVPKKRVEIEWIRVSRENEQGHLESERLRIPTLKNVPKQVKSAFDAQVSKEVGELRDQFLKIDKGARIPEDYTEPSFIETRSEGSSIYKNKYASVLVKMNGAARLDGHITGTSFGFTMDVTTGNMVSLDNFVEISRGKLSALRTRELKRVLKQKHMSDDPWHVLDGVDEYAWMVSDKGVTFRYYAEFEGGWDYKFTLPWSELRG